MNQIIIHVWLSKDLLAIEMKKVKVNMNKPIYLGMPILDISKIRMYEFWYDYLKPKYKQNLQLCYMDTDTFIFNVKTEYWYKDISNDILQRFDTSNIQINIPVKKGKNKKVLGVFKDELNGCRMKTFIGLRPKCYAYLQNNGKIGKRAKGVKRCVTKKNIKFSDSKNCLMNNKKIMRSQQVFKSEIHVVSTVQMKKSALSNTDDKRFLDYDGVTTHTYGSNVEKTCKNELLTKVKKKLIKKNKQHTKMFNLDNVTNKNDNKSWPHRMLIIGPSGSGKTNALLNLIQQHNNVVDKIHLYPKDLEEPKYQFLIKKRQDAGIKT